MKTGGQAQPSPPFPTQDANQGPTHDFRGLGETVALPPPLPVNPLRGDAIPYSGTRGQLTRHNSRGPKGRIEIAERSIRDPHHTNSDG